MQGFAQAIRDRSDSLDFDVVTFSGTGDGDKLQVVAHAFDTDMVICLPFG